MHDAANSLGTRRPAHVLGTGDVDGVVILHRSPDPHHAGEVEHPVHAAHWRLEGIRQANVTPVNDYTALFQPACILGWQREYPHAVTPVLQGRDQVPADKAVAPGDQDLLHARTSTLSGA